MAIEWLCTPRVP